MDLVYICKDGDNEELRYSIRSAVTNMPHKNIWVVGGKPEWYSGSHISVPQTASKMDNARNNLLALVSSPEVSQSFILMNDDFFTMRKIDYIPAYHGGYLSNKILRYQEQRRSYGYIKLLNETFKFLKKDLSISNPLDYELHVPMVMEKDKLKAILGYPGLWRSLYGNVYNIDGTEIEDVKAYSFNQRTYFDFDQVPFISTEDDSFEGLKNILLKDMFPYPSSYENPYAESNCG